MALKKECKAEHTIETIKHVKQGVRKRVYFECGCWDYWYRFVWIKKNGPIPKGYEIHHKDLDSTNDKLSNLQLMTEKDHKSLHGKSREWSEETRNKISESLRNNPNLSSIQKDLWSERKASGWTYPEEGKKKISEALKGKMDGEKNPFYGKKHTAESNEKNRQAHLGKPGPNKGVKMSDEARRKMSEAKKGKPGPRKGIKMSDETKRKLSEAAKKRLSDPAAKKKVSEGLKRYHKNKLKD